MLFKIILGVLAGYGLISLTNDIDKLIKKFKVVAKEKKLCNKIIKNIKNNKIQFKDRFNQSARFVFLADSSREILIGISLENKSVFFIENGEITYNFMYYEKKLFDVLYNAFHKELTNIVLIGNNSVDRKTYERITKIKDEITDYKAPDIPNQRIYTLPSKQEVLDKLLDKICKKGYDSLTEGEKEILESISKNL